MPNPTWTCCAEPPPCPTCPEACDYETSYVFDGFGLSFSFSAEHGSCQKCTYAGGGGTGSYYQLSYGINVTVTQIGQAVLTRFGSEGNCCYEACGTMEVEWEITDDVQYGCCQPEDQESPTPAVACSGNQTITGVEAVPYHYEVFCTELIPLDGCPDDSKGRAVWMHRITLCAVQVATSHKGYVADCNYNPTDVDCGEEPRGPLLMAGAVIQWFTPLIDLAAITPGMANNHYLWPCLTVGGGCTEECDGQYNTYQEDGPFSIMAFGAPCTFDQATCYLSCQPTTKYGTDLFWIGSVISGCDPYNFPWKETGSRCPCGNWGFECDCHRIDAGHVISYPNYA